MKFARALLFPFWNARQARLRAGWRLLLHLGLTLAAIVISANLLVGLVGFELDWESTGFTAAGIAAQAIAILSVGLFCYLIVDRRSLAELRLTPGFFQEFCLGGLLGAALMTAIFTVALLAGWLRIDRFGAASLEMLGSLLASQVLWFTLMLAVSISEEFFSRGLQLKNLAEGLRPLGTATSGTLAVLISAAFFGILHSRNTHATLGATLAIIAAGIMLATARIVSGRLAMPIGLHATWNYFQGPIFGLAVSGTVTDGSLVSVTSLGPTWLTGGDFGPEAGMLGLGAIAVGTGLILGWRFAARKPLPRSIAGEFAQLVRYRPQPRGRTAEYRLTHAADNSQAQPENGQPPSGQPPSGQLSSGPSGGSLTAPAAERPPGRLG